ncbi:secretory carrier-associated membrane protein 2-like [Sycon ciliatum]|uniref:secretory carrier-associated membrane protein 2-like n=1 Tax=Sycon ciliatum TaxID=27933 RepID=UPI0031F6365F
MSGFDGNPFADPEGANPFSDPSVTQHTSAAQKGLEEYNPFADDAAVSAPPAPSAPEPASSAPIVPKPAPPSSHPAELPPYAPASQPALMEPAQQVYGEKFPGEEEPIVTKEKEPEPTPSRPVAAPVKDPAALTPEQELELARREPNFPPCLKMKGCPVKPCFYHNINLEIPQDRKKFVRLLFFYWQFYCFTLFVNVIACAAIFGISSESGNGINFGFAILWFFLFIPCSFWCWYWCGYNAFKSDSSMRFMFFFFIFFFQFVTCCVFAVGIQKAGGAGMIVALSVKGTIGGLVLGMLSFILWTVGAVVGALLLIQIHRFYRTSGYSVEKMQAEAGTAVAQNEGVRKAVVAGVKGSMN